MANQHVPSSSFSTTPSWTYDVLLSFRGEDTRTNFTDHLYHALVHHGIRTFIDHNELRSGEEISPSLLKAIRESRIYVIVFSENYASSRWCLDELVHILECRKSKGQMTRPIFYKVDPSDVRHQSNSYEAAFADHSPKYENNLEKVQRWRIALTEAANLKGATLNEREYETKFINDIVEEISTKVLNRTYLHVPYSGIRQLKGFKNLAKLTWMNLTWMNLNGCEFLEKIPDLSGSPNIKHLILKECKNLVEVDDSVGFLVKLVKLDFSWCSNLTRFVPRLGLRSLEVLNLRGCTRLERFPEIEKDKMKSLTHLEIGKSGIRELPSSIAYLTRLRDLSANGCELQNVPDLSGCANIEVLDLSDCTSLVEVDDSVGFLDKLLVLKLSGCSKLTRLTRLASRSLFALSLRGCRRLESFPEIEGKMESLHRLDIEKSGIRELPSIAYFTRLRSLKASGCELQNIQLLPFGKKVKFDEISSCSTNLRLSLNLEGCNLSESDFLVPLDCWSALTALDLSRNNFVSLPDCISKVVNLDRLFLMGCKRLREIPILPPKLKELHLDGCTSLEKIPKLPPRLAVLSLCHCSGLSGDEVAKLENNLLNEEIYLSSQLSIIYPGNEVPKWFSYTSNHPTTIQPLPEYEWDEYDTKEFVGGSEYRFEIPLKLQVGETLLGLALSFVLEPSTYYSHLLLALSFIRIDSNYADDKCIFINGKKKRVPYAWYTTDIRATHVRFALVNLEEQEQQVDICQVVFRFRSGSPIKSCGVHCLLRNQDELLRFSLRPTSSLGKRPRPRGSSDIVDDEYDHPKRRQIDLNVPFDIEEDEEQLHWSLRPTSSLPTSSLGKRPRPRGSSDIVDDIKHTVVLNLPSNFRQRHLAKFDVSYSGIRQLKGFKNLANLTWICLSGCEFLEKILDLSGSPNIKHLNLRECKNLVEVDDSVGFLDKLVKLDFSWCSNLTRFVPRLGLRSLEELNLEGCTRLERFPKVEKDKMKSLTCLKIGKSGIRELPSSIAYLTGLTFLIANGCELQNVPDLSGCANIEVLDLSDCTSLVEVDDSVGFLDNLEFLNLSGCSKLTRFATRLGSRCWSTITTLNLSRNNFVSLPDCISKVVNLERLFLMGCKRLREIPVLPPKLKELHLEECISLEKIPKLPPSLEFLNLCNCLGLSGDEVAKLENNLLNEEIYLSSQLSIIYPGNEVPKWFSYTSNYPTTIQPLPEYIQDDTKVTYAGGSEFRFEIPLKLQVGKLALSFVVEPSTCYSHHEPWTSYSSVKCILFNGKKTFEHYLYYHYEDLKATHVSVTIVPLGEQEQHGDICQVVLRFRKGYPIKSCGVHCLLRNQDELLHLSLRPTSRLGKRPHPRGSSDIVDDEYDQQQQWLSSSSEPADDHPKRRQIDPNVPMDIEEDEEQDQLSASDDPQFLIS